MINIILPVVENPEKFAEFVNNFSSENVKFFVGIRENLAFNTSALNAEVHRFNAKAKQEEIINALHTSKMEEGKILIARRPLTRDEFVALTTSKKEIATLKAKHNSFFTALKNFAKRIVKTFFAFTYFEDISAICFGQEMFALIKSLPNLSFASRINKYVGLEVEEVETTEKQVKKQYSRAKNLLNLCLWSLLLAGSIAGGVLICTLIELKALFVVIAVFWIVLAAFFWFIGFINFMRTLSVGNLHFGRAQEV